MTSSLIPHKIGVGIDPPSVITRPWVDTTIRITKELTTQSTTFTSADILAALREQYGLSQSQTAYLVKLIDVKYWAQGITPDNFSIADAFRIQAQHYNPDETDGLAILTQDDVSTATHPVRLGFAYGLINSTRVFTLGNTTAKFLQVIAFDAFTTGGSKIYHVVNVKLRWCSSM